MKCLHLLILRNLSLMLVNVVKNLHQIPFGTLRNSLCHYAQKHLFLTFQNLVIAFVWNLHSTDSHVQLHLFAKEGQDITNKDIKQLIRYLENLGDTFSELTSLVSLNKPELHLNRTGKANG